MLNKHKILKLAKGFRGRSKNCYRLARNRVEKGLQYQWQDRRYKKRKFRELWIQQINAGVRQYGMTYNNFAHGLVRAEIALNRNMLSLLAKTEPFSFKAVVHQVQEVVDHLKKTQPPIHTHPTRPILTYREKKTETIEFQFEDPKLD